MKKYIVNVLILVILIPVWPVLAQVAESGEEEIRELMEARDRQIKAIVGQQDSVDSDEQREQLKMIVNDIIDFESLAAYALDTTWDELDTETQQAFITHFTAVVREQSLSRLDIYRANVTYESIDVQNGTADVSTVAEYDDVRVSVDYDMELQDGHWVITDLILDDVSTAESYRTQFSDIIRQHGFDRLLKSLETRASRIG